MTTPTPLGGDSNFDHATVEDAAQVHGPGPWWIAHEHPERPPDEWAIWSWSCDGCTLHLIAAASRHQHLGSVVGWREGEGNVVVTPVTTRDILDQARAWRAECGLRAL